MSYNDKGKSIANNIETTKKYNICVFLFSSDATFTYTLACFFLFTLLNKLDNFFASK